MIPYESVLRFWFEEIEPKQWWGKSKDFDQSINQRFGALHQQASACELWTWRESAKGRLAEIIILDQFSRNIYRDQALSFSCDPLALGLAQSAVQLKADQELEPQMRAFMYMPYMHSESLTVHEQAKTLFASTGLEGNMASELKHCAIIERFGRYPHRNAILGRQSTPEELEFLSQPNSSF